jgi:hypothetical protein
MAKRRWIQGATAHHRGALHRALGIPPGKTIPLAELRRAAGGEYGELNRKRAQLALNLRHLRRHH